MSDDSSVSFLVLAIIIAILVVSFFVYSTILGMVIKRRNKKEAEENVGILSRITLESLVILDLLLNLNKKNLSSFVPATSGMKMSYIQDKAKEVLEFFFIKNKFLFVFFLENKNIEEPIKIWVHKLHDTKSNLWEKHLAWELKQLHSQIKKVKEQEKEKWLKVYENLKGKIQGFYDEKTNS